MDYHYRSVADLNSCIVKNISRNPKDIDLIVGIPRSGTLAASMLALHTNSLLTDVEGFLQGKLFETGRRLKYKTKSFDDCKRVLVLDDSVRSGRSIREIKARIGDKYPDKEIFYAAVFGTSTSKSKGLIDICYAICPVPRLFEWNLMHHDVLRESCVDLDGVLCRDPSRDENDDSTNYIHFIQTVEPYLRPTVKLGYIVTNRLEKYRPQTEAWLQKHGIDYGELIMLDLPNKQARRQANCYSTHKAKVYIDSGSALFVESSELQSREISRIAGRSVFCVDTRQIINPSPLGRNRGRLVKRLKKVKALKPLFQISSLSSKSP
ncbi:MAG: hypothetical protein WBB01_09425 [Phormidesmis sp.]